MKLNMYGCVVDGCKRKHLKRSAFCGPCGKTAKRTWTSHKRGLCPLKNASGTPSPTPKPKAVSEDEWAGDVGYEVD